MIKRILSGIQPTGNLHLGNYLGAIHQWVKLQNDATCLFCIVDMHAITNWQDPSQLKQQVREMVAAFIACGIDVKRHIIFNQSQVPAHAQLAWVLNCVARVGWLDRMTQFKEKAGKNRENASVGLYTYPNLMAADILLYHTTHVPVGEDQKQHLELARDIAQKFNNDYNINFFPLPEPLIQSATPRVMSLRDGKKKMSKSEESDYSRINLTDNADTIVLKLRKAKTDPLPIAGNDILDEHKKIKSIIIEERPEMVNLLKIYAALDDKPLDKILEQFAGKQFSDLKKELADLMVEKIIPIGKTLSELLADISYIDDILSEGKKRAMDLAAPIWSAVEDIVGFLKIR
ncbi:MAG: tryptophan--tRNA ligase [Alphaproteobacteria bacterium]|nr:tryptophan--tRNA ligase [Alphaproteobacteria bacterium]